MCVCVPGREVGHAQGQVGKIVIENNRGKWEKKDTAQSNRVG